MSRRTQRWATAALLSISVALATLAMAYDWGSGWVFFFGVCVGQYWTQFCEARRP